MRPFLALTLMTIATRAEEVRMTVYHATNCPKPIREDALDELKRLFGRSGLGLQITEGDPNSPEAATIPYPEPPKRGRELEAACAARADIALEVAASAPPT